MSTFYEDEAADALLPVGFKVDEKSTDDGARQPWERLGDETSHLYSLFCYFRDMGPRRNLGQAAKDLSLAVATLRTLSSRNGWVRRAESYDAYLERQERLIIERGRMEARRRQINLAQKLQEKGLEALLAMNPHTMNAKEATLAIDVGVKLERQARGEVDTKRVEHTGEGGGPIEVAQGLSAGDRLLLLQQIQDQIESRMPVAQVEGPRVIQGEISE